ncbi:hypothetical protein CEY12_07130 [Chryseobacterium sp. T16E-39]|uniref:nuclear transport factor 2 family protein n=1 Tax=Chryseobacterium sp. T16E-39 TaxID=2015076 RepID=UPI000B5B1E0F|nr:nuclear transport factor 2 family protein [Chryseobacterium sp. T16E-39]ASK32707.1 hypothetical protein CEY12_07130 [Chryseobacterium sp. T16E-39]
MDIPQFIKEWIDNSNAFKVEQYLTKYHENAVLDDPSVGRSFKSHKGIREYFEDYFIGYNTHTKLVNLHVKDNIAHAEVLFTGDFPGGKTGGTFDFTFKDGKIIHVKADLI